MKKWETMFEVRRTVRTIVQSDGFTYEQNAYAVFIKSTGQVATKRYYSSYTDAKRGAAQIFNSIEKKLLGLE